MKKYQQSTNQSNRRIIPVAIVLHWNLNLVKKPNHNKKTIEESYDNIHAIENQQTTLPELIIWEGYLPFVQLLQGEKNWW